MTWEAYIWKIMLFAVIAYLCGTFNFALIISKLKHGDIREKGSGNPGTMNMLRNYGFALGVATLALDCLKGVAPVLLARVFFAGAKVGNFEVVDLAITVCGLFAILGHIYPVWLKFHGGKGVATTIGVFFAISPMTGFICFVLLVLYMLLFEYGSIASLLAIAGMSIGHAYTLIDKYMIGINMLMEGVRAPLIVVFLFLILICFVTWFAHRSNIVRLVDGREHKTPLYKIMFQKNKDK